MIVDVHVFCLKLSPSKLKQAERLLQPDEQRRAAVMRPEPQVRYIAARAGLRALLGERLGQGPSDVAFCYGAHGKPNLSRAELSFSLAHSGDWAALALTSDGAAAIGIDLELQRSVETTVHDLVLHPDEKVALEAMSTLEQHAAFLDVWVTKEAILKASGLGLQVMPNTFQTWGRSHLSSAPGLPDGVVLARLPTQCFLEKMSGGQISAVSAVAFGCKDALLTCRLQAQEHPLLGGRVSASAIVVVGEPFKLHGAPGGEHERSGCSSPETFPMGAV